MIKRPLFIALITTLLLSGIASSIYLTTLYLEVQKSYGSPVESFCAINTAMNCVTVASSNYSAILEVPFSVFGLEFYGLALVLFALSFIPSFPIKRYDSVLFVFSLLSLPAIFSLAYISYFIIQSVCLLCCVLYVVNISLFLLILFTKKCSLLDLLLAAWKETLLALQKSALFKTFSVMLLIALISQFFWIPKIISCEKKASETQTTCLEKQEFANGLFLGSTSASLIIEEFVDYQCPVCAASSKALQEIVQLNPEKIYLRHRNFPLDSNCNPYINLSLHPKACLLALYSRCAAEQNLLWTLQNDLYLAGASQDFEQLNSKFELSGANMSQLENCLADPSTLDFIREDIEFAVTHSINKCPSYLLNNNLFEGSKDITFWTRLLKERSLFEF